ncbi:tetratricopeptide repeat protein [Pseudomaricurvus alkylphenolicus]|uniref:tetratricopeptide repeat protein n=1 Tax=Pseudomaricurvus alkylphenolicus TaxID=1306991 RepID=UPI00141EA3B5|nr:tetratricopeptide repeat protein [Pseudomaricurvus alkylphenolicus]
MKLNHHLLTLVVLVSISAGVQEASAFSRAEQLFQQGDYARALDLYLQEEQVDRYDASLLYNIAVCYYRLKRWDEANARFLQLVQKQPDNDLIRYNLAVTEKKLGNRERAKALFFHIAQLSEQKELSLLAQRQYDRLNPGSGTPRRKNSAASSDDDWLLAASVTYGSDDNVVDPTNTERTDEEDRFSEALLAASWYSNSDDRNDSWVLEGTGYFSRYDEVDDYDVNLLQAGVTRHLPTDYGSWYLGTRGETSQLGGDDYLRTLSLHGGTGSRLSSGRHWALRYRLQSISSLASDYDYLQGSTQRLEVTYGGAFHNAGRWKLRYRFDNDNRDDLQAEDLFYSYSASRHSFKAQWSMNWDWVDLSTGIEYRFSDYHDDHVINGLSQHREDNRLRLNVRAEWLLSPQWSLTTDYSFTDNDSSIEQYDYNRNILMFGAGFSF